MNASYQDMNQPCYKKTNTKYTCIFCIFYIFYVFYISISLIWTSHVTLGLCQVTRARDYNNKDTDAMYTCMCHITHMNASCHTHEPACYKGIQLHWHRNKCDLRLYVSYKPHEYVVSHKWISYRQSTPLTEKTNTIHACMRHMTEDWFMCDITHSWLIRVWHYS